MIEQDQTNDIITINIQDKDARIYWKRLVSAIQLRHEIDTGRFTQNYNLWSGRDLPTSDAEDARINILPTDKPPFRYQRGLRHGVLHAIDGSYRWLVENGYAVEAQVMVDADRARSRREGLL